jgi:hypothetical protein
VSVSVPRLDSDFYLFSWSGLSMLLDRPGRTQAQDQLLRERQQRPYSLGRTANTPGGMVEVHIAAGDAKTLTRRVFEASGGWLP